MGAAPYGDDDVVRYLVEYGAEVQAVDSRGRTALSSATEERKSEVVEFLTRMSSDQEK
jgi:ankyrin repeat protein